MPVWTLLIVMWLANGSVLAVTRETDDGEQCHQRETAAHEAAKQSSDVIDVGTLCVKSNFDLNIKPRA